MRLLVLALLLIGAAVWPGTAQPVRPALEPSVRLAEPVRLCGTNSSRSRRCFFGNRDCIENGRSHADCLKAQQICHRCIDIMVACMRDSATSCDTCGERYGACMTPWVALISKPE